MIICVCNDISEEKLIELSAQGKTLNEIMELTGLGSECGSCIDYLIANYGKPLSEEKDDE